MLSYVCSYLLYQSFTRIMEIKYLYARICYSFLSSTLIKKILLSATHFRPFFFRSHCISNSSKLFLWWWIGFGVWLTDEKCFALFPAGTIIRDPHHLEFPTRRQQDLNLRRTWVKTLLNEVVQWWSPLHHGDTSIGTPYQLSTRPIIYLYVVIVSCTCVQSLINLWYQLLLSFTSISFPNKIFVSGIPIRYSSVTTQFLYSKLLPYQLLLSTITVSLLQPSCSGYSSQVLLLAIFISYSFLLLPATLISYL